MHRNASCFVENLLQNPTGSGLSNLQPTNINVGCKKIPYFLLSKVELKTSFTNL